jgi:TFIIF-interacting CTD phosphatase-like protein
MSHSHKKYDCIVLDLDGTLVYTSKKDKGDGVRMTFCNMYDEDEERWVHKRPGFEKFINHCFAVADVGVWSMAQPGYVDAVVKLFPQNQPLSITGATVIAVLGRFSKN